MQSKIYEIEGKEMCFNTLYFKQLVKAYKKNHSLNQTEMFEHIASFVGVSPSTVENWYRGKNGPMDLESIEELAHALGLNAKELLLEELQRRPDMNRLSERQVNAVKRITDKCVEYSTCYLNSDGYDKYYQKYKAESADDPLSKVIDLTESFYSELFTVFEQEYFDLHGTDVYRELNIYIAKHQHFYSGSAKDQIPELLEYDPIKDEYVDMEITMICTEEIKELREIIDKYIN